MEIEIVKFNIVTELHLDGIYFSCSCVKNSFSTVLPCEHILFDIPEKMHPLHPLPILLLMRHREHRLRRGEPNENLYVPYVEGHYLNYILFEYTC